MPIASFSLYINLFNLRYPSSPSWGPMQVLFFPVGPVSGLQLLIWTVVRCSLSPKGPYFFCLVRLLGGSRKSPSSQSAAFFFWGRVGVGLVSPKVFRGPRLVERKKCPFLVVSYSFIPFTFTSFPPSSFFRADEAKFPEAPIPAVVFL